MTLDFFFSGNYIFKCYKCQIKVNRSNKHILKTASQIKKENHIKYKRIPLSNNT